MTITDNGDGTLSAAIDGTQTITNSYKPEEIIVTPDAGSTVFGEKKVTAMPEDNKSKTFEFTLEAVTEGAPMPLEGRETGKVTFEADEAGLTKTIPFGTIT